jgi:hypothetical protein
MTGTTIVGQHRWFWRMGIMARDARFQGIMRYQIDLREACGASGIIFVAQRAMFPSARDFWFDFSSAVDMRLSGTMAGFAIDILMVGLLLGSSYIVVAFGADLMAGVIQGMLKHGIDGVSAIMSVFAETLRSERDAKSDEKRDYEYRKDKESFDLFGH